jgi:hypothetical protein
MMPMTARGRARIIVSLAVAGLFAATGPALAASSNMPWEQPLHPHQILRGFIDRTDRVLQLIEGFVPEAVWLSDCETLTYLHSSISMRRQRVRVPEAPMYLDAILVDEPLVAGSRRNSIPRNRFRFRVDPGDLPPRRRRALAGMI